MSPSIDACRSQLERRFGSDVSCDVVSVDGDCSKLWFSERDLVARAVSRRQREFAAGRACARTLLARHGFEPAALLRANDRSPLWPNGAIGSISHHDRLCAVAVARMGRVRALGLDIEPDEPLDEGLWPVLFVDRELRALARSSQLLRGRMARVLFSAKESVFKCTSAIHRGRLGFHQVEIALAASGDEFVARVLDSNRGEDATIALAGFHFVCDGSIFTGMSVRSPFGASHATTQRTPSAKSTIKNLFGCSDSPAPPCRPVAST